VHAMGGHIDVSSTLGEGSRFTVHVPLGARIAVRRDARFIEGSHVLFLSSADEWSDFVVPHLTCWGAQVQVARHPAVVAEADLEAAAALVIWGTREQWLDSDENRLVENAAWVVDGYPDGPARPIRTGRVLSVSCVSLTGLEASLRTALLGEALPSPPPSAGAWSPVSKTPVARGLKVLVAEDNEANRMLLAEQLGALGCQVTVAANGRQALELLDDDKWDVLLTDLNMPRMSGYELAQAVRKRRPELPIVAVTAHATREEKQRCEGAGMDRVVTKPISLQQLSEVMAAIAASAGIELKAVSNADEAKFTGSGIPKPLWDTFIRSVAQALADIDTAQAAGDVDALIAQLHSVRGALAVYGQAPLAAESARLEADIRRDRQAPLPEDLEAFKHALKDLLEARP